MDSPLRPFQVSPSCPQAVMVDSFPLGGFPKQSSALRTRSSAAQRYQLGGDRSFTN